MKPGIFRTGIPLNLQDKINPKELGTQAACGRCLKISTEAPVIFEDQELVKVQLCEDGYEGYLKVGKHLDGALTVATCTANRVFSRAEILKAIPDVLNFLFDAMQKPNRYLWGGTIGPNFDCSGLVQASFASQGIWLPRDAKEQFKFTSPDSVQIDQAEPGDLVFFSRGKEIDHAGIHIGNGFFIHSSGSTLGRDGIGIDRLFEKRRLVAARYRPVYRGCHQVCSAWPESNS